MHARLSGGLKLPSYFEALAGVERIWMGLTGKRWPRAANRRLDGPALPACDAPGSRPSKKPPRRVALSQPSAVHCAVGPTVGFPLCVMLRVLLSRVRGVVGGRWGSCVRGLGGVAAGWRPWCVSAGVCRGGGVPRSEPVGVGVLVRGGRWGLVVSWLAAVSAVLCGTYSYVLCLMPPAPLSHAFV